MTICRRGGPSEDHGMTPRAQSPVDQPTSTPFPAVLLHPDEDVADLARRLEACLLIVRKVAPALTSAA